MTAIPFENFIIGVVVQPTPTPTPPQKKPYVVRLVKFTTKI